MDVQQKLDEITSTVENARSMPMSASIVVNKADLIAMLAEVREALPSELAQAQQTVQQGDQVVEGARREAERVLQEAQGERARLISGTEIAMHAQAEADRILAEARAESEEERREADDYVDSKLANFEVVLTKTLGAIGRGRQKLRIGGAPVEGEDGEEFAQDAFRSPSPEVDEYVDVKLAALETALSKTLDAVGRGRDKLLGKAPADDLGAYLAAADHASGVNQGAEREAAVAAELARAGLLPPAPPEEPQYWQPVEVDANGYPAAPYQDVQQYDAYGQPVQQHPQQPQYDQYGYQQVPQQQVQEYDPYAYHPQQVPQQPPVPQYAPQQYDAYGQPVAAVPHQSLDETSFFDTGFIDVSKLRELGGSH